MALALVFGLCAGLPWALVRFVGWPLPDHVPTLSEVGEALTRTLSTNFLLDVLACGAWLLWFALVVEVLRCAREVVLSAGRLDLAERVGPLRRIAAVLITAVVVSFVSRTAVAAPSGVQASSSSQTPGAQDPGDRTSADVELVRPPRGGVHDSLYRIAQRRLGDGDRWPEIWRLNTMSTQPGGRKLTSPSLIHPGDRIRLPTAARRGDAKPSEDPAWRVAPSAPMTVPPPSRTAEPSSAARHETAWGSGVFVGLGLAGAVSAALLVARRRHRAHYRPGSGRRGDDLPVAPVVYRLHMAHQDARNELEDVDLDIADFGAAHRELGGPADDAAAALALDLARSHGLGLVGPGAHAAARALLLTVMTTSRLDVVVPGSDLCTWLGISEQDGGLPRRLHVVRDFAAALEIVPGETPRVLLATVPTSDELRTRLHSVVADDCGGTTALLLGQWHLGSTIYVKATGVITATSPGAAEPLCGQRAFTLPESATRELFALFHAADEPELDRQVDFTESVGQLEITDPPPRRPAGAVEAEVRTDQAGEAERHAAKPLVLSVFGQPRLSWHPEGSSRDQAIEITGRFSKRLWELLICLALRPDGAPRTAIIDSLWAGRAVRDPAAVLRTVISRVRGILQEVTSGELGDLVVAEHGRYRLAPALVEVDYWAFATALARRKTATSEGDRLAAHAAAVASYGGELAAGFDAEWLVAPREGIRRDALDAVAALARGRVHSDPEGTLELLETARDLDPHNELLYRDIMRLEHNLGRHEAIARTLRLLEARLAEIDESPTAATVEIAERLRALHVGPSVPVT